MKIIKVVKMVKVLERILHSDRNEHFLGNVMMTPPSTDMPRYGGEWIYSYREDTRMVPIRKLDGKLYVDDREILLSSDLLLDRNPEGKIPLSGSISEFLSAHKEFIPRSWARLLEDIPTNPSGRLTRIAFQGTTYHMNENHIFNALVFDPLEQSWSHVGEHDILVCRKIEEFVVSHTPQGYISAYIKTQ